MTAGQEALREAARIETARIYSRIVADTTEARRRVERAEQRAADEAAYQAAIDAARVAEAVRSGASVADLMLRFRMTRAEARARMSGAA